MVATDPFPHIATCLYRRCRYCPPAMNCICVVGWIKHGTKTIAATMNRIHHRTNKRRTLFATVDPLLVAAVVFMPRLIHPTVEFRFSWEGTGCQAAFGDSEISSHFRDAHLKKHSSMSGEPVATGWPRAMRLFRHSPRDIAAVKG